MRNGKEERRAFLKSQGWSDERIGELEKVAIKLPKFPFFTCAVCKEETTYWLMGKNVFVTQEELDAHISSEHVCRSTLRTDK